MNKAFDNEREFNYFEIVNNIYEYIDVISKNCKFSRFDISPSAWNMLFTEIYNYLNSIHRKNDYFGVLYVTINNSLRNALIKSKKSIDIFDIVDAINEIRYLDFNNEQVKILKRLIFERIKTLNEGKVIYLSNIRKK